MSGGKISRAEMITRLAAVARWAYWALEDSEVIKAADDTDAYVIQGEELGRLVAAVEALQELTDADYELLGHAIAERELLQPVPRQKLIDIAQRHAAASAVKYDYLHDAADPRWMPHQWVIDAMQEASQ